MDIVFVSDNRDPAARSVARSLREAGYEVALNDLGGESVPDTRSVKLDLTDCAALSAFFAECGASLCGAVHPAPPIKHVSLETADEERWSEALRDGALASLMLTRACGEQLRRNRRGAIIYLGSIHAEKPVGGGFLTSLACASTESLAREAALDFGRDGVGAYYVERGPLEGEDAHSEMSNVYAGVAHRYPQMRRPDADSLNGLVKFLLSEDALPLSGSELRADFGYVMYYGNQKTEVKPV